MNVQNKVIVITGGAGGIGSAQAKLLARNGAEVWILDLVQEKIDDLNAEIINTMTSIGMKEDEIAAKETELSDKQVQIDQTQEEYNIARHRKRNNMTI